MRYDRSVRALLIVAALGCASPASAGDAIEHLRSDGYPEAAAVIERRIAQRSPKMKLTAVEGQRAARALQEQLARSAALRRLAALMPKSSIELARAVAERGLPASEADAIADYLGQLVAALDFANLGQFDENHSHVTGRRWHEIDYSGEPMTWRGQKRYWSARGVGDFRSVKNIEAYMRQASKMRYFRRIYRPRGSMRAFRFRPRR